MPDAAGPFATVAGGPLLVAMGLSALVGLIGFLSPCVLPLIPGYLSDLAGLSREERAASQRQMIGGSMLFAAGFHRRPSPLGQCAVRRAGPDDR